MDFFEKLNFPRPPPHEAFYTSLHQSNISNKEYALVVETWQKKGWTSLKVLSCEKVKGIGGVWHSSPTRY